MSKAGKSSQLSPPTLQIKNQTVQKKGTPWGGLRKIRGGQRGEKTIAEEKIHREREGGIVRELIIEETKSRKVSLKCFLGDRNPDGWGGENRNNETSDPTCKKTKGTRGKAGGTLYGRGGGQRELRQ